MSVQKTPRPVAVQGEARGPPAPPRSSRAGVRARDPTPATALDEASKAPVLTTPTCFLQELTSFPLKTGVPSLGSIPGASCV